MGGAPRSVAPRARIDAGQTLAAALAAIFTALLALAALATAFVLVYAIRHAIGRLSAGDDHRAAQWAAVSLAGGVGYIAGYASWRGLVAARRALAGDGRPIALRPLLPPLAVALAGVLFQGLLAAGSYFTGDDWLHLVLAHQVVTGTGLVGPHGLDLSYLDQAVFIHYAPGHRFVYWVLDRFAPLDWPVALGVLLVLFAGCVWLLHRICVQLFGRRRSTLVVPLVFATSVVLVPSFLWFADGVHKLPSTFLTLLAIHAYLRHRTDRSPATLALAVAAMSLGLLFYAKVLLVPLYIVLIRLLFLERRPGRWWRALWEERWTWLAFAAPVAIYLWNYQLNYASLAGHKPPLELLVRYLASAWFRVVVPAFAGLRPGLGHGSLALVAAVAMQALFVAVGVASARRKPSAWRAWMFALIVFVANDALVGTGRLESFGFFRTTTDLRYQTELTWLLPLAVAFAFHPSDVADGERAAAGRPTRRRRLPAVALACYLIAMTVSGALVARDWITGKTDHPKAYVQALQHDARRPLQVLGYEHPGFLVPGKEGPWSQPRTLVPAISPRVHFVLASSTALAIRADGHIRPAHVQPFLAASRRLDIAGTARAAAGTVSRRGDQTCLSAGRKPGVVQFIGRPPSFGPDMYASVRYAVLRPSPRPALVTSTSPGIEPTSFPLTGRGGSAVAELGDPLTITIPPHAAVCMRSLSIGWLYTRPGD